MLTYREAVQYLLQHELLSPQAVVESSLTVIEASRRNHNLIVIQEQGPCYLLKQGIDPDSIATIAREAAIYQRFRNDTKDGEINRYLPPFYGYDAEKGVLILEFLPDGQDLRRYHTQGRFSKSLARQIGQALGTLHQLVWTGKDDIGSPNSAPQLPWVFSLHHPHLTIFQDISSANLQLIKFFQQSSDFSLMFDSLRQDWQRKSLIHYDIKWDNFIAFARSSSRRKTGIKIIDWEFASVGDPCWDVGSIFSDYLSFWLLSIPTTGETPEDRQLELARYPLEQMQPAIRAFWQSYCQQMKLDADTANQWLLRAVRYGAARLVQTAFEQTQMLTQSTNNTTRLLDLSLELWQQPLVVIVHFLGIPLPSIKWPQLIITSS